MKKRMNERIHGWMTEWWKSERIKWIDKWTNEQINKWMNERMNEWMNEWMNKRINKWIYEWKSDLTKEGMKNPEWTNKRIS